MSIHIENNVQKMVVIPNENAKYWRGLKYGLLANIMI